MATSYAPKPEKPPHHEDEEVLQFVVSKANRGGNKSRIVSLNTRPRTLVTSTSTGQRAKTFQLKEVTRVERNYDKRKCSIFFGNRGPMHFTFSDAAIRERFLGRLTLLWELALAEKASLHQTRVVDPQNLKMIVLTWNVGESLPPASAILSMCLGDMAEHDLYVIALQECSKKKEQWCSAIKFYLEFGGTPFVVVKEARLWDMVLLILAKDSLARLINHVEADTVACGVGDVLGNKGGIGISLCINDTSICFLNSHLAARAERVPQRQANFMRIVRSMQLGLKNSDILNQFDHVIWAGDLNYRVDADFYETIDNLKKGKWADIYTFDQLIAEMQNLHVFLGFKEGPLEFAPTYRWDRNTNEISNKREQTPSWTDRVLWKSLNKSELVFKSYSSVPDAVGSDHRPVFATFELHPRAPYTGVSLFSALDWRQDRKHIEIMLHHPVACFDSQRRENQDREMVSVVISSSVLPQSINPPSLVFIEDQTWGYLDVTTSIDLLPFIFDKRTVMKSHLTVSFSLANSSQEEVKVVEESKLDPKAGLLGCAVISLEHAFDEDATFHALITNAGQPVGEFSGKFQVVTRGTAGWHYELPPLKPTREEGGLLSNLFLKSARIFQDSDEGVEVNTDTEAIHLSHVSFPFQAIKERWLFCAEEYLTPRKDPGPVAALHGALCCLKDLYCLGGGAWAKDIPIQVGLIKATADCGNTSVSMGIAWIYFRNKPDNQALGVLNCGTGGVRLQLYIRTKKTVVCLLEYKPPGNGKGVFSNLRVGGYAPSNPGKEQTPEQLKEEISTLLVNAPWNNAKLLAKLAKQFKIKVEKLVIPVVAMVSGTIRNFWERKSTEAKDAELVESTINSILEDVLGSEAYVSSVLSLEKKSFLIQQRVEGQLELVACRALYSQFFTVVNPEKPPLEPVISLGIGKGSSQWTSLYYALPDAHNRYSLEPSIQFGMDSDELAERLASAVVAQYRPYQEGLKKMMLSVVERGNVPCFALKSGCLLSLDDASRGLKGVSGKARRMQLVNFPAAVAIPPVDVILSRRSGQSEKYVLSTNSVAVVCADACSLLAIPGEDPRPQFIKVNVKGESDFLSDMAGVAAGTELVFSTARELMGKPNLVKEKPAAVATTTPATTTTTTTTPTTPATTDSTKRGSGNVAEPSKPASSTTNSGSIVPVDELDEFDLAVLGAGRSRRLNDVHEIPRQSNPKVEARRDSPKLNPEGRGSNEDKKPTPALVLRERAPPEKAPEKAPEKPVRKGGKRPEAAVVVSTPRGHVRNKSSKMMSEDDLPPPDSDEDGAAPPPETPEKTPPPPPPLPSATPLPAARKARPRTPDNVDMYDVYRFD